MKHSMPKLITVLLSMFFILSLLPVSPVIAQDVNPPEQTAPRTECPIIGSVDYPCQNPDGSWSMPSELSVTNTNAAERDVADSGGPDTFGYTWDNSAPYNWIDASGGTDSGFGGNQYHQKTGPISLPFVFNYYGFDYSELYITDSGFVSFDDPGEYWPYEPYFIPLKSSPNNLIAPFWVMSTMQSDSWVRYQSGGSAPNRYFVVEWHNMYYAQDPSSYFTFQVILYEDGNFAFQYETIYHGGTIWAGSVRGCEDQYGADGLYTLDGGIPTQGTKILVTRPDASARVTLFDQHQGLFTQANTTDTFDILVSNVGDFGNDTFDIIPNSLWDAEMFDANGIPLTDTDSDGIIDTGNITPGTTKLIKVKVTSPMIVNPGETNKAEIQFVSSVNPSIFQTAYLQSAVSVSYVQSYFAMDENNYSTGGINFVQPFESHLTPSWHTQGNSAIAATANGFALAYSFSHFDPETYFQSDDLAVVLFDQDGNELNAAALTENYPNQAVRIDYVTVAGAPNGYIGIAWVEEVEDSEVWRWQTNIYFMLLNSSGEVVVPKTNLSNNTTWTNENPYLYVSDPKIVTTDDSHIMIAWRVRDSSSDRDSDIFYTIMDTDGNTIKDINRQTDSSLGESFYYPTIAALTDNKFLMAYAPESGGITYLVLDSVGNLVQSEGHFGSTFSSTLDCKQLSNGKIALVWEEGSDPEFAILDGSTYALLHGPTGLTNPASPNGSNNLSVTSDYSGNAILTWTGGDFVSASELYYAVFNGNGTIVTEPLVAVTGRNIAISRSGYGNTPYPATSPTTDNTDLWVEAPPSSTWSVDLSSSTTTASSTITFGDQGLSTATGVVLSSTLAPDLTFQSASLPPDQINGNEIVWNLPDISSLNHGRFTLNVDVPNSTAGTAFQINWEITSTGTEANPLNNIIVTEVKLTSNFYIPLFIK